MIKIFRSKEYSKYNNQPVELLSTGVNEEYPVFFIKFQDGKVAEVQENELFDLHESTSKPLVPLPVYHKTGDK